MRALRDEDLILYYYGEAPDRDEIGDQLERSPDLRERYAALCLILDAVEEEPVPEPPAAYGSRIWHRIAPQIEGRRGTTWSWAWLRPRRQWALATVMALLLIAAFLAGRWVPTPETEELAGLPSAGRERILLMTVAGHLERSEMLLLELVNTVENGEVDLSVERQLAGELGQEGRLFRQAARQAGRADLAALLEQLETVLVELSHGPERVPSAELGDLRVRLEDGDLLFRVRVLGSNIRREMESESRLADDGPRSREL